MRLVIPRELLSTVIAHAQAALPNECCGFLSGTIDGDIGRVGFVHLISNRLASPTEFETEPRDVLSAFRTMRAIGTDLLAIYHSHPTSDPVPSHRDIDRNTYGAEIAWLIVGHAATSPQVELWMLNESHYVPARWEVNEDAENSPLI